MTTHDTHRAPGKTTVADAPPGQPAQTSGEPDNESQYGGGRQVDMPREQNREAVNPPRANREKAPADDGRLPDSSGPSADGSRT